MKDITNIVQKIIYFKKNNTSVNTEKTKMELIKFLSDHRCMYYRAAQNKLCFISTVNKVNFHHEKIQKLMFLAISMKYRIRGQNSAKSPQMALNHCFLLVLTKLTITAIF